MIGEYDIGTGRYTLHCGFQRPWLFREAIAKNVLRIPETQLRLITGDIGGSYGLRGSIYPELVLMPWAACRVGRPVKWLATRNEAHVSDDDARDNIVDAALALDSDGKFLGVRIRSFGNLGAYVSFRGAMPPVVNIGTVCGTYTTPAVYVAVSGILTNTHCTSPYRGAGRSEASYMIERLINIAADEIGMDPAELRRRNTIPPSAMPYRTPLTFLRQRALRGELGPRHGARRLDGFSGAAEGSGEARHAVRHRDLEHHRVRRRLDHRDRGNPLRSGRRRDAGDWLDLARSGPRHNPETQILVDRLGVDPHSVKFIQGDTDAVAFGMGTGGSRSTTMSGGAIVLVSEEFHR